jgi:hypothetical protein
MRHRLLCVALIAATLLLVFLAPSLRSAAQSSDTGGQPDQIVLRAGEHRKLATSAEGYLSPLAATPHPFTHMLLRWEASVPDGAVLTLFVRASIDGASWGEWTEVIENDDLWSEDDGPDTEWSQTIDAGAPARFWQVLGHFTPAPGGALPELRMVEVNTVDARFSTATARADSPSVAPSTSAISKPPVVSRIGWGSPDGQGSRVAPYYYPVNHMVVHHTADSNTLVGNETTWADRVRAEWAFHTYTRGWGDVGYNYLIDPNGVIYEGRAGGDDTVAFHDTGNYGSMGVVLIGTYATVPPTAAAQDALVWLLAWKAAQKQIDPLASSYYYGCDISRYCRPYNPGAIVPNIAGHRQVTPGHTTCPGNQTVEYLPGIRNRVKQMLMGGPTDDGDLVIDELESSFARSPNAWHEAACGYGGHTYWTYTTDGTSENSATWRPTIPAAGTYRVYAHIPQGCGLAPPPYATTQAKYRIGFANGGYAERIVDQNTATEWVDLGAYTFDQGNGGAVELFDDTDEPLSAGRVIFFDAVKWVPESSAANIELRSVQYDRTTLASGELLRVAFTVRNIGDTMLHGQNPRVDLTAAGGLGDLNNGYVYDQDECFVGDSSGGYPAFPKESNRFRVVLGFGGWDGGHTATCASPTSDYPWRWGLNADLAPGQEQTIVGYIRFRTPGTYTLQAGVVQEYIKYYVQGANPAAITVTPERIAPDVAAYDAALNSLARVYRLGSVPDNFLARTRNPLSIPRGQLIGSFPWSGSFIEWGAGGPLGLTDQFLIEQTRSFLAPASGQYTFRTTSDDGSWLWVDGAPVVVNNGLHASEEVTGTIVLSAGPHVVSFKYFERTGDASAGYGVQLPGAAGFSVLPETFGGAARLGSTFLQPPDILIAADDQGGAGVVRIRWSLNDVARPDVPGALLSLADLPNGTYRLRYDAVDGAGNQTEPRELAFSVNTNLRVYHAYLPVARR